MALPAGYTQNSAFLNVKFIDNGNKTTRRRYQIVNADITDFLSNDLATIHTAMSGVSEATIATYSVTVNVDKSVVGIPAAGIQNENTALLTLGLVDATKTGRESIPAADPDIFIALAGTEADVVDSGDAAVAAFISLFQPGGGNLLYLSDGEQVNDTYALAFRKGKRLHHTSPKARAEKAG